MFMKAMRSTACWKVICATCKLVGPNPSTGASLHRHCIGPGSTKCTHDIHHAQVTGHCDRMGAMGAAAWPRWQAFLGCLGCALVPQSLALAAAAPAAWGVTSAALGAAVGVTVTAAITLPNAQHNDTACTPLPAQPSSATQRSGMALVSAKTADLRRTTRLGSSDAGLQCRSRTAAALDGAHAERSSNSSEDGHESQSRDVQWPWPDSIEPAQRLPSRSVSQRSTRAAEGVSDNDGEHGLGRWRPFWATVPAWSATLLLMLEPVKLLVRLGGEQPVTVTDSCA